MAENDFDDDFFDDVYEDDKPTAPPPAKPVEHMPLPDTVPTAPPPTSSQQHQSTSAQPIASFDSGHAVDSGYRNDYIQSENQGVQGDVYHDEDGQENEDGYGSIGIKEDG